MTIDEKLEAAQESAEAHKEQTGHEEMDIMKIGRLNPTIVATCSECGQRLATVQMYD